MRFLLVDLRLNAIAREIGPILPRYIAAITTYFPAVLRMGVTPRVRPTVAVALTAS